MTPAPLSNSLWQFRSDTLPAIRMLWQLQQALHQETEQVLKLDTTLCTLHTMQLKSNYVDEILLAIKPFEIQFLNKKKIVYSLSLKQISEARAVERLKAMLTAASFPAMHLGKINIPPANGLLTVPTVEAIAGFCQMLVIIQATLAQMQYEPLGIVLPSNDEMIFKATFSKGLTAFVNCAHGMLYFEQENETKASLSLKGIDRLNDLVAEIQRSL